MHHELLRAVCRHTLFILECTKKHRTFGVFAVHDVLDLILCGIAGEGALGATDLHKLGCECIDSVHLDIDNGLAGSGDNDLRIVLSITACVSKSEAGVLNLSVLVIVKEAKSKTDGVRAGVINAAGYLALKGLPVPSTGEGVVLDVDLLDLAKLAAVAKSFCKFPRSKTE